MSENGEIYTASKNFTLPPALTALTNSTSVDNGKDENDSNVGDRGSVIICDDDQHQPDEGLRRCRGRCRCWSRTSCGTTWERKSQKKQKTF